MICDPADTRAGADIRDGVFMAGQDGRSVPVALLTVNSELVFAKHGSGKRDRLRVSVCRGVCQPAPLSCGGEMQSKWQDGSGWE